MTFRVCSAPFVAALLACLGVGCGAGSSSATKPSAIDPLDLYPLREGNAWSYDVDTGEPSTTLGITRVESFDGRIAEVRTANVMVVYEVRAEGIYVPSEDAWLIRVPLEEGATWRARGGRTARVVSLGVTIVTAVGELENCVEVLELGGKLELEVRTTYCPAVGPVLVASTMRSNVSDRALTVSARLRGFSVTSAPVLDR